MTLPTTKALAAMRRGGDWHPTTAHFRALVTGSLLAAAALLLRRPDLLVLGSPLLGAAVWGALTRQTAVPRMGERLAHPTLREGEATTWSATVESVEGLDSVTAAIAIPQWLQGRPSTGVVVQESAPGRTEVVVAVRSLRWGIRPIGPGLVVGASAWGAYRWAAPQTAIRDLITLPQPVLFDTSASNPRPSELVGLHRSARPGEGSEFADIREFHLGDRLRRIHWPTSLRTGELHVTSTWAERDTQVALVVDAFNDLGPTDGVDGRASSLDVTVRAAGAIAEHYLHSGDRVGLRILGSLGVTRLRPASGRPHLRRVLDTLAAIKPATNQRDLGDADQSVSAGVLVVLLSPLVSPVPLQRAVALARRGVPVVVIDTLPPDVAQEATQPAAALAWRIRLLEREREIRTVQHEGVPVVPWRGPGSLDQVLRDIRRRSSAPRMVLR